MEIVQALQLQPDDEVVLRLERARQQVSDNTERVLRKRKTLAQLGKLLEKQEIEFNSPIMQGIDQLLEEVDRAELMTQGGMLVSALFGWLVLGCIEADFCK